MAFQLTVEKAGKIISLQAHQIQHEQAKAGETYRLVDAQTGLAPEDMTARHEGNDLILSSEKEKIEVVIEDFWDVCTSGEEQCWAILPMSTENAGLYEVVLTQEGAEFMPLQATQTGHSVFDGTFWLSTGAILVGTAFALVSGRGDQDHVSYDKEFAAIEDALAKAQQAQKDAQAKFEALEQSGIVNTQDAEELTDMIDHVKDSKEKVEKLIDALPEAVEKEKQEYAEKLVAIPNNPASVPAVNDVNSNGKIDTEEAKEAQKLVDEADKLNKAYNNMIVMNAKSAVNHALADKMVILKKQAEEASQKAKDAVSALPESVANQKASMQATLDKFTFPAPLPMNDANNNGEGNGIPDEQDLENAKKEVELAKTAVKALQEQIIKTKGEKNDAIDEKMHTTLIEAQKAVQAQLDKAKNMLQQVPEQDEDIKAQRTQLASQLEVLAMPAIPPVNDMNANGFIDVEEAKQAQNKVNQAKEAYEKAKAKIAEMSQDGHLVTPTEKTEADNLLKIAKGAKNQAKSMVDELTDLVKDQKEKMEAELAELKDQTVPSVNDANSNGIDDNTDVQNAKEKLAEVKKLYDELNTKIKGYTDDTSKTLNPTEHKAMEVELEKITEVLKVAQEKIGQVPNGMKEHNEVQQQYDAMTMPLKLPKVNDLNSNNKLDTQELKEAFDKVKKTCEEMVAKITEIKKDHFVTQQEHDDYKKLEETFKSDKANMEKLMEELMPNASNEEKAQYDMATLTPEKAPAVSPKPETPHDLNLLVTGTQVSGKGQPYSTVTVMKNSIKVGETTVGEDGNFTIKFKTTIELNETITLTATNPVGSSDPVNLVNKMMEIDVKSIEAIDDRLANNLSVYNEMRSKDYISELQMRGRTGKIKNLNSEVKLDQTSNDFISHEYTDDRTPTFSFRVPTPLNSSQEVVVMRTEMMEHSGKINFLPSVEVKDVQLKAGDASNTVYTFTDNLPETTGAKYRYEFMVKETHNGKSVYSKPAYFDLGLDTIALLPPLKAVMDANIKDFIMTGNGVPKTEYFLEYATNSGHMAKQVYFVPKSGEVSFKIEDWNRTKKMAQLFLEDVTGNVVKTNITSMKGLYVNTTKDFGTKEEKIDVWDTRASTYNTSLKFSTGNDCFLLYGNSGSGEAGNRELNSGISQLDMDNGDDTLSVGNSMFGALELVMGRGNDRIDIFGKVDDQEKGVRRSIFMDRMENGGFNADDGSDTLNVLGKLTMSQVNFGNGENHLFVKEDLISSDIISGKGDDIFTIQGNVSKSMIDMGAGNDILAITGNVTLGQFETGEPTKNSNTASYEMTTVQSKVHLINSNKPEINLGNGDDSFFLGGNVSGNASGKNIIDGGSGLNSLVLTGKNQTIDMKYFLKFGKIDLTGSGENTLQLTIDNLAQNHHEIGLNHGTEKKDILMISGTSSDKVKFGEMKNMQGSDGKSHSSSFITHVDGTSKGEYKSEVADGKKYNLYMTASSAPEKYKGLEIWIQDGVHVEGVI